MNRQSPPALANVALVGAAFVFGTTFVTVKSAVSRVEPIPFLAVRFCFGALLVVPFARRRPSRPGSTGAGILAGVALLTGYGFQTVGLQYTTGSVSAFITYLLVVFVPVLHLVTRREVPGRSVVIGIAVALVGLFLLSGSGRVALGKGELLTLVCALGFAVHILVLHDIAPRFDPVRLNAIQLATVGGACLVPGFFLGGYGFPAKAWLAVVYTGAMASAVAFFLQTWAQARVPPTRTALLLLLEPVFAAVLGYLVGDRIGWRGAAGAALILGGVIVAEVAPARRSL